MTNSPGRTPSSAIPAIEPYSPGKTLEAIERELGRKVIRLASNENPLGPSPRAIAASERALAGSSRYPDDSPFDLTEALASRHGVAVENIVHGAGASELIALAARIRLWPGDIGVTSQGTFLLYPAAIRISGAELIEVPLVGHSLDLDAMASLLSPRTKLIYLANPNNPTGTMFTALEFERFLARVPKEALVVLDEAYFDYVERADYSTSVELVRQGANILVLRTFSKVHGLAGIRIGYGIAASNLVMELNNARMPFNVSSLAQAAALAALGDSEHIQRSLESNRAGFAQLSWGLDAIGIRHIPSVANFVLVDLERNAQEAANQLLTDGVYVRPMAAMGFPNAIRVTVGTREENDAFLQAIAQVRAAAGFPSAENTKGK